MKKRPGNPNFGKSISMAPLAEQPLSKAFSVRFDQETALWVEAFANENGIKKGDVIRDAIEFFKLSKSV